MKLIFTVWVASPNTHDDGGRKPTLQVQSKPMSITLHHSSIVFSYNKPEIQCTCYYNKVRELIAVRVLHTSLLNTTVFAIKLLLLGSYAPIPAPSPPFKTILELVL